MLAATTLVVVQLTVVWFVLDGRVLVDNVVALSSLHTAEAVLAVVMVATALAHWRAVGRTHGLLVAVAGGLLGLVAVLDLVDLVQTNLHVGDGVRSALSLTALAWVARAVLGPEVDTSLRLPREIPLAAVTTLGALAVVLGSVQLTGSGAAPWSLLSAAAWFGLALVGIIRAVDRGWGLLGWMSWAGVAIGISELARWEATTHGGGWAFVSGAMGAAGLLIGAIGGTWALARVATTHRSDVYSLLLDDRSRQERERGERRELAHEIRNALLAVEGATATMERLGDRLTEEQRQQLQRIVQSGMASLRALVSEPSASDDQATFRLDELVRERVSAAETRGVHVEVEAEGAVEVQGEPSRTGRAVDNLLLNAERHGGAGTEDDPITVVVGADVDVDQDVARGVVRVMDRGPGVPAEACEAIFLDGHQLDPRRGGQGIGLHAARDLARGQHGDLHYEARPDGGACFVLSLPLRVRDVERVGRPSADEVEDGR